MNKVNKDCDLLYITFVDLNNLDCSGSSVRPFKMLKAFEALDLNIKVLDGWNNQRRIRKNNVRKILEWLKTNTPKMCYVEPPSGPIFCAIDLKLLRRLHKVGVPIAVFYRDAYWKFPSFDCGEKRPLKERLKLKIVKVMQQYDLHLFKKVSKHIFFPSDTMAELFEADNKSALPPACVIRDHINYEAEEERIKSTEVLTYFYVGGASKRYGTQLLVDSFKAVNAQGLISKLILVCPEKQWNNMKNSLNVTNCEAWLKVVHTSGDENLSPLYEQSDIAIIPLLRSVYNDFAIPIKMYEYMSFNKPMIVTNCTEMKNFVMKNNLGWVVKDNVNSLYSEIIDLNNNRNEIIQKKENGSHIVHQNTWKKRAETIIKVLR